MSFPAQLAPAARSAYRAVLRATRITFHGDPRRAAINTALRQTFSSPYLVPPPSPSNPSPSQEPVGVEEIQKRITDWNEIAAFLRKNVVQGEMDASGSYKLRVTQDTELGDNASIREPAKLPTTPFPNRNRRRKCGEA